MEFLNKVIVVTGASSGMGREISLQFAKEGAKVIAVARREERLNEIRDLAKSEGYKGEIIPYVGDLSKEETPNDKSSKIIINNKKIYISNEYLINKILYLFKEGKYYFTEDMFVIDGDKNDFKGKIPISQMISYLTHLLVTTIKSEKKHNYSK